MKGLIILDFNRTVFDPENDRLVLGAQEFLDDYAKRYHLALISKAKEDRHEQIHDLGLDRYFGLVIVTPEKTIEHFRECLGHFKVKPQYAWSIGDRVQKEIYFSNQLEIPTVWFKQGKFASIEPSCIKEMPTHIVYSFDEIRKLILL